jgi:hypothetical protein
MLNASNNKHEEDMMLTKKHSKLDYLQSLKPAYRNANRQNKKAILDVAKTFTGYHRTYIAYLLRNSRDLLADKPQRLRNRRRRYGPDVVSAVLTIQHALAGACGELVQPALSEMADKLEAFGHLKLTDDTKAKLGTVSLSTVKRMLKANKERSYTKLKLQGTTKAGDLLKAQVAVRIGFWDETEPGFFEVDTVAHNGSDPAGTFVFTVNMTDVLLGWTEPFSIMGKGEKATVAAIEDVRSGLPYAIVGIDSDGGGEFINWHLKRYTKRLKINFTRSRAYHSDDNAHIEQKNNVAIRWTVGYARYDTPEQLRLLNQLFRGPWRLYFNFFLRTRKVTSRSYDKLTGKTKHVYDKARTPYQRVLDHPNIPEATKDKLRAQYATLDPMKLLAHIEELQRQIRLTKSRSELDEKSVEDTTVGKDS